MSAIICLHLVPRHAAQLASMRHATSMQCAMLAPLHAHACNCCRQVLQFFASHGLQLPEKPPLLLVDSATLGDAEHREQQSGQHGSSTQHSHGPAHGEAPGAAVFHTLGLTLLQVRGRHHGSCALVHTYEPLHQLAASNWLLLAVPAIAVGDNSMLRMGWACCGRCLAEHKAVRA